MNATEWTQLGSDDQGDPGLPGDQYSIIECTIYRRGDRYRAVCYDEWGNNRAPYREQHGGGAQRRYSADSLDDLLRIAISGERESLANTATAAVVADMATAIRNAVAEAEDAEAESEAEAE